jgi:alanyl-tRNA synthetase
VTLNTSIGELRASTESFWTNHGFPAQKPTGLISPVFPAEFNMSGGHSFVLPALSASGALDKPQSFYVLERCLRRLDLHMVGYSPHHLSLLEMAVAAKIASSENDLPLAQLPAMILDFLELQGITPQMLVITCCGGGMLGNIPVPPDENGRSAWINAGISEKRVLLIEGQRNIIYTDGLPHPVFGKGPRPAGLAYEIFWQASKDAASYMEIASVNLYTHLQQGKRVSRAENKALGVGFGMERLVAAKMGHGRIFDTPSLKQIIDQIRQCKGALQGKEVDLYHSDLVRLADRIRAVCFILADGQDLDKSPRGKILADILKGACKIAKLLNIDLMLTFEKGLEAIHQTIGDYYPHIYKTRSRILSILDAWLAEEKGGHA